MTEDKTSVSSPSFAWARWRHLAHMGGISTDVFWALTPSELQACLLGAHDAEAQAHSLTRPQMEQLMRAYPDSHKEKFLD